MALVAWISYRKTRGEVATKEGYFLAGRSLSAVFIAGSMLLTNLSSEQLIGLNGSAYGFNLSSMGWEVTAAFATICMAFIFLPRYLSGAFSTLPEFLTNRFDGDVRKMTVILFMFGYGLVTIPSVLYSGSIAVLQLFDLPQLLNLPYSWTLVITIWSIGLIGSIYAILGGLRAVVVSDTLNGIGLLLIGLLVPILGFSKLGDGDVLNGIGIILNNHTEKLNAIGATTDPTPFGTLFTGMIFANLFYWCTNQYVIQRTLAAKSLAEGQKGVLLSGYFKVIVPFIMMIPGVIAFHLYSEAANGSGLTSIDLAYPQLIKDVLPVQFMGLFLAVLLGAVFSSFNSLVNSAATLFCIDIYIPYKKGKNNADIEDNQLLKVAKYIGIFISVFSFIVAPLLQFAPSGLWQIIRIFTGFYNIPVIAIVIVGLFNKNVPALGPKIIIIFHVLSYGLLQFVFKEQISIHFLHIYAILFFTEVCIMLLIGKLYPLDKPWKYNKNNRVSMDPWVYSIPTSTTLMSFVIIVYLLFSSIGVVNGFNNLFYILIAFILSFNLITWAYWIKKNYRISSD